jgi:hypothetical protein
MYLFRAGSGYKNDTVKGYEIDSIGNLGYSSVQCSTTPIGVKKMAVACPYGTIGEILYYGVQPPTEDGLTSSVCKDTS